MEKRWNPHPMFGIREKLSLSFAALLIVVIVLGAYSVRQFIRLGNHIDVILRDNLEAVQAARDMQEGVQRIDNGMFRAMLSRQEEGESLIRNGSELFLDGLETLEASKISGLEERIEELDETFPIYLNRAHRLLEIAAVNGDADAYFVGEVQPLSDTLKSTAGDIQELRLTGIALSHSRAQNSVTNAQTQIYVALACALVLSLAAIYYFGREFLIPILQLTNAAESARQGNLDVNVPIHSRDEIGQLTDTFNGMLAQLFSLEKSQKAQLLRLNRATVKVLDNIADAIALVTPAGRIEIGSRVAAAVFGLENGVNVRRCERVWIGQLFDDALQSDELVILPNGSETIQEFVEGDEHFFYPAATAIYDDDDTVTGVLLIIRDITHLTIQEELKRDAVATVSHQLKTPLTAIRMSLHMLTDSRFGDLTDQQRDLADTAREESDRLFRMVQGLLDMSRIKSGRVTLECNEASPESVLSSAAEVLRAQAAASRVTIAVEAEETLPNVWVDGPRLEHVFINLASNALKFTPEGGSVRLSATEEKDWVRFAVADTGPGIPEHSLNHIFEPFYRAPDQADTSGAGLGLAIAYQITTAHGGRIEATNHPEGGAVFTVWLPRADAIERLGLDTRCEDDPTNE